MVFPSIHHGFPIYSHEFPIVILFPMIFPIFPGFPSSKGIFFPKCFPWVFPTVPRPWAQQGPDHLGPVLLRRRRLKRRNRAAAAGRRAAGAVAMGGDAAMQLGVGRGETVRNDQMENEWFTNCF